MKRVFLILTIMIFMVIASVNVLAQMEYEGKFVILKDRKGKVVTRTAHQVSVGDQYLTSSNELYRVVQVKGESATVQLIRKEHLEAESGTGLRALIKYFSEMRAEVKSRGPIVIYHTHTDESYVPSDGQSSKQGNGGIIKVGEALTKSFERKGIPVVHDKSTHDPHDAFAYDRSRRTAAQLLRKRPSCVLDVHRDAVPPEEYAKVINGKGVTKIQLVVGRENPNFKASNAYAKKVKAEVDKKYPGFIKGIFYGKGKYNQDLGPRTLLLEFGSHTNSRESAERSTEIFANAASHVLYGTAGAGFLNLGSLRNLFWIIVATVIGVGLYLLVNRKGLKSIGREFAGAVGEERTEPEDLDSDKKKDDQEYP